MIDPSAVIAPTARVHADAHIGPQVFIGEYAVIEYTPNKMNAQIWDFAIAAKE